MRATARSCKEQWPRSAPASRVARIRSRRAGGPAASWEAQMASIALCGSAWHVQVTRTAPRATCAWIAVWPDGSSARSYCSTRSAQSRRPALVGLPLRPTPRSEEPAQVRSLMPQRSASRSGSASRTLGLSHSHSRTLGLSPSHSQYGPQPKPQPEPQPRPQPQQHQHQPRPHPHPHPIKERVCADASDLGA